MRIMSILKGGETSILLHGGNRDFKGGERDGGKNANNRRATSRARGC